MTRLPQVLLNVRLDAPMPDVAARLAAETAAVAAGLGARGRVLLRPSGTEPVVRVMAEAPTEAEATAVAERLAAAVEAL
jgi:phosphoglucosamine mutase